MPVMTYIRGAGDPSPRIFIAIPANAGIHVPCVASLVSAIPVLHDAGIAVDFCFEAGNCHVDDARNSLVRQFLKTDCTDLVFIDSDVGFRAEDLLKLVTLDRDVVAGVYPKKQEEEDFPVYTGSGVELRAEADGCVEVLGAPTGFMRIRRAVLEKMVEAFKHRQFQGQSYQEGDAPYTLLFEREIADGRRWSGDYNFCRRWIALGGKVYVHPEMSFTHEGLKEWKGRLGDFWRRVHGVTKDLQSKAFDAALDRCKAGNPTIEDFVALSEGWNNPWAGGPELLETAYYIARRVEGPILECGSGLTTLVMAAAGAEVHALEHEPVWASYTASRLKKAGLSAEIQCAPLEDYGDFEFYDTEKLPEHIGAVICDGPPRTTKGGRTGVKTLMGRINGAVVVLDDPCDETMNALKPDYQFELVGVSKPVAVSKGK